MAKKRMAWQTAHYLGILTGNQEEIVLMGVGIKSLNRSPAPKTTTDAYINDKNASPTVTGYDTKFNVSYDDIIDDQAIEALQRVADEQLIGEETEFYYYRVDISDEANQATCPARRYRVSCQAGDETNESTNIVSASCTLAQVGDMVKGTFNKTTKTFAAEE